MSYDILSPAEYLKRAAIARELAKKAITQDLREAFLYAAEERERLANDTKRPN